MMIIPKKHKTTNQNISIISERRRTPLFLIAGHKKSPFPAARTAGKELIYILLFYARYFAWYSPKSCWKTGSLPDFTCSMYSCGVNCLTPSSRTAIAMLEQ